MAENSDVEDNAKDEDEPLNFALERALQLQEQKQQQTPAGSRPVTGVQSGPVFDKTREVFKLFDHEADDTMDARYLGTAVRSLNLFPTDADLDEIREMMQQHNNRISLKNFCETIATLIQENSYEAPTVDELKEAFGALDVEKIGQVPINKLSDFLTSLGEPFSEEELEAMIKTAPGIDDDLILYSKYTKQSLVK